MQHSDSESLSDTVSEVDAPVVQAQVVVPQQVQASQQQAVQASQQQAVQASEPRSPEKRKHASIDRLSEAWCGVLNNKYSAYVCNKCGYTLCGRCYLSMNTEQSPNKTRTRSKRSGNPERNKGPCGDHILGELREETKINHYWGKDPDSTKEYRIRTRYRDNCENCHYILREQKESHDLT